MDTQPAPSIRESRVALAYVGLYLAYLFITLESELTHWLTLVVIPILLATTFGGWQRSPASILKTFGLRRKGAARGVVVAVLLGTVITVLQVTVFGHRHEILSVIQSGRALWLYPVALVMMMVTAGFTEEFFFRGYVQTRLEVLTGSAMSAILIAALIFSLYHLPYALLNPRWPSAGSLPLALGAAFANGLPGGLVLGALYAKSGNNLLPCIVLHSMINAAPAMTLIRFGG